MLVVFISLMVTRPANSRHSGETAPDDVSIYSCEYTPNMLHTYILIHFVCATTISETNSMGNIFKLSLSFLVSQSLGTRLLHLLTYSHA